MTQHMLYARRAFWIHITEVFGGFCFLQLLSGVPNAFNLGPLNGQISRTSLSQASEVVSTNVYWGVATFYVEIQRAVRNLRISVWNEGVGKTFSGFVVSTSNRISSSDLVLSMSGSASFRSHLQFPILPLPSVPAYSFYVESSLLFPFVQPAQPQAIGRLEELRSMVLCHLDQLPILSISLCDLMFEVILAHDLPSLFRVALRIARGLHDGPLMRSLQEFAQIED